MANIQKLEFVALDISGNNYLRWQLDAELHLQAKDLGDTIMEENESSMQDRAKALIFLRHHIHEDLKSEYLTIKDPLILWSCLKERYNHQKTVILPKARDDWKNLRIQDFKTVYEYNSTMFNITSRLRLCGEEVTDEEMLEKTLSTFHANNLLLHQQYRERRFQRYSELISCLMVAEQNNELLLKNHQSRPTGSASINEANAVHHDNHKNGYKKKNYGRRKGKGPVVRDQGKPYSKPRGGDKFHNKWNRNDANNKRMNTAGNNHNHDQPCHRCGLKGHWANVCRTPKHFVNLYQASMKRKDKMLK